jgi:hypothetical protein
LTNPQPIGVIRDVSGRGSFDLVALFQDSLVLVKGSFWHLLLRSVEMQFGALGILILHPLVNRAEKKRIQAISNRTPADIVALNPKNQRVFYAQVIDAQFRKSLFSGSLTLKLVDGTTKKYTWRKGVNKPEQVSAWLRHAFGTKLAEAA